MVLCVLISFQGIYYIIQSEIEEPNSRKSNLFDIDFDVIIKCKYHIYANTLSLACWLHGETFKKTR